MTIALVMQIDLGIVAKMSFSLATVRATKDHPFMSDTILGENDPPIFMYINIFINQRKKSAY